MSQPAPARFAAFDCGTNSLRLLIAEYRADGTVHELDRQMRIVRLGEGVDRTGAFAQAALERTHQACTEYAQLLSHYQVPVAHRRFVATSASRDVSNRDHFAQIVHDSLELQPEVISGDEEARLSFSGAIGSLGLAPGTQVLVVDLGGGSTEFVLGKVPGHKAVIATDDAGAIAGNTATTQDAAETTSGVLGTAGFRPTLAEVSASCSVNMGCVRFTERFHPADPPQPEQINAMTEAVDECIAQAGQEVDFSQAEAIVGVAGTVTTITAEALGLAHYDAQRIHATELPITRLQDAATTLLQASQAERAARGFMHPGRVDVIGAGALIYRQILRRAAVEAAGLESGLCSEKDILDGTLVSAIVSAEAEE